jgi:protein phosphatase
VSVPTPRDTSIPVAPRAAGARQPHACIRHGAFAVHATSLDAAVASAAAARHAVNEDCHSALDNTEPLFVVADGVGGGAMAARASRELVAFLHACLAPTRPDARAVREALLQADRAIERSIASCTHAAGAATVALCAATANAAREWLVAWVGDCRVYRVRAASDDDAQLLTRDDSYGELREQPPAGGSLGDPARMVGNGAVDAPNVVTALLDHHEMLVLCSDGVHKHVDASDIARVLRGAGALERRCARIVELARAQGSDDDATVLVVQPKVKP